MGGIHHPVPGGELRDQGHHRGHGRAGRGQGPAREHRHLVLQLTRQEVVVRLPGRHRAATPSRPSTWRSGTSRARSWAPACSTSWVERSTRSCPSSPRATPTTRTSARWSRRPRSGSRPVCTGVKVGFGKRGNARLGYEHDRDVEYMRRMREGLGPDQLIMIDCGWNVKWDVSTAVRRVQAFEEYDLHWIEEPLLEWDPEGYANLRGKTTTLIAYGEKEWDLRGLRAGAGHGDRGRRGHRPGTRGGHHRLQEGDRAGRARTSASRTPTPGRAPSAPRPAWPSASARRPPSCSSSSRCATRCSTTS